MKQPINYLYRLPYDRENEGSVRSLKKAVRYSCLQELIVSDNGNNGGLAYLFAGGKVSVTFEATSDNNPPAMVIRRQQITTPRSLKKIVRGYRLRFVGTYEGPA